MRSVVFEYKKELSYLLTQLRILDRYIEASSKEGDTGLTHFLDVPQPCDQKKREWIGIDVSSTAGKT